MREAVESPGNSVMYYLTDGPERAFVSEELMLIPEDTELPPDYVQEWEWSTTRGPGPGASESLLRDSPHRA